MKFRFILMIVLISLFVSGCKVIFWSDTNSWMGVRWKDDKIAYEPVMHYQSKLSWNPMEGNTLAKDYQTEIIKHTVIQDKIDSLTLTQFKGWILEGSLYQMDNRIFLIRGTNDALGSLSDRQILILPDQKSGEGDWLVIREKLPILLAIPAPSGKILGVLTSAATEESPDPVVYFVRYDLQGKEPRRLSEQKLEWRGAPGVPLVAWDKNSEIFYLFRDKDVLGIYTDKIVAMGTFPECFLATRFMGEVSSANIRLFRQTEGDSQDATLVLEAAEAGLPFDDIPMTSTLSKIQAFCTQQR